MVVGGMGRKDRGMKDGGDDRWGGVNKGWEGGVSAEHTFAVCFRTSSGWQQNLLNILNNWLLVLYRHCSGK